MVYAPVVIPTLNRYGSFKRCVESLKRCSHAEKTELYIALDYPPSDKYVEGYHQICEYIEGGLAGFQSVNIIKREKNYGVLHNALDAQILALEKHEVIIMMEDDNEVSPCFLDYCNKCLELYQDDKSIAGVNATNYVFCDEGFNYRDDLVRMHDTLGKRQLVWHGLATWKDRFYLILNACLSGVLVFSN